MYDSSSSFFRQTQNLWTKRAIKKERKTKEARKGHLYKNSIQHHKWIVADVKGDIVASIRWYNNNSRRKIKIKEGRGHCWLDNFIHPPALYQLFFFDNKREERKRAIETTDTEKGWMIHWTRSNLSFYSKPKFLFFFQCVSSIGRRKKTKANRVICLFFFVFVQKWRELWQKSDYEDWLYRRPQLPVGASDDDCNSIYELPERVSSSRPVSTYYSSATILASDSAVYSAYYWSLSFFCWFHSFPDCWPHRGYSNPKFSPMELFTTVQTVGTINTMRLK